MDTPSKLNDRPERGSCSCQTPRRPAHDADLTRRLSAVLGTYSAQIDPGLCRALGLLFATDVIRDVETPDESVTRDGEWALLTLRMSRTAPGGWVLDVVCHVQIHAFDDTEDTTDITAVRVAHGMWATGIDARCHLTPGELDYLSERVEAMRAWVRAQCHDDDISAAEARRT